MATVPRVPPFHRPAAYGDLVAVPEPLVAEVLNGELHASPRPAAPHTRTASDLGGLLLPPMRHGRGGPGGWRIFFGPELPG
jgi:hypothetical protein